MKGHFMQTSNIIGKSLGEIEVLTFIQTIYQGQIISGYIHPKVKKRTRYIPTRSPNRF